MKTYFVTGATGAIGSALIPILLQDTQGKETRVRLLLRAKSSEDLALRLEALFSFWQTHADDIPTRSRVKALRGDVTLPRLGLDEADYQALCAECTHIVHSAGNVRMNLPIEQARHSSVDSAQNIIALAHDSPRLEKVEFVSTVGVGGRTHGAVPEEWILTPRGFHNTYEQAKAEAEDVIRAELEHGMALTVHRPSMVVGDTISGRIIHFQVFYHLCEFLSGRRTLGLAPGFGVARLDIVPADYVAKIIAWSSGTDITIGRILHSCSGPDLALPLVPLRETVRQAFVAAGRALPPVINLPTSVFRALLTGVSFFMPAETRRAIKTLPVFLDYLATEQSFSNCNTTALLATPGLAVPPPHSYLDKVLAYYLGRIQV
ncbi:Non-ribosomal peptide synthase, dehydrogenase domain-containing protein [Candidatus Propionivibrio aalborgensis]|uniref:Non-ribosomal peptide synthase, dehydrogenase domain-containing protein n=1 Tax=Candidatus Propionivibrio aalborgensis TaxID=1860101 RepID=A0A1A8XT53_9RHOO|nr:SDR family oxidoreductase [Candidatus Propionivibrio aalborgensis]SBT08264.1 Non-ribosomal peptide synthase, dehydrogenase domain-containing protein [Candidatus Propionivibrio aalborgensis]